MCTDLIVTTCIKCRYYSYFTGEKTGGYQSQVPWPRSQLIMVRLSLKHRWLTCNHMLDDRPPTDASDIVSAHFSLQSSNRDILKAFQIQCDKKHKLFIFPPMLASLPLVFVLVGTICQSRTIRLSWSHPNCPPLPIPPCESNWCLSNSLALLHSQWQCLDVGFFFFF